METEIQRNKLAHRLLFSQEVTQI
uniref:Uncharacterized protein n=1 Tax=Rhizophora mucronata TaxID=61149 RepID=A0A2P2KLL4_RHIMU